MKLLLTSAGISNKSIENALVELLGKPISESSALFVPTAIYPFPGGGGYAWRAITGTSGGPLAGLGWKSMGVLELTVLPNIDEEAWLPTLRETDALLLWGGDVMFLTHWLRQSGVADVLPTLERTIYVGTSAGSLAATATIGETYIDPPRGTVEPLTTEAMVFDTPQGKVDRILVTGRGLGLVDFSLIPHLDEEGHEDASLANAEIWASKIPARTYAIDDQTAIKVVDGQIDVISEGHWKMFEPAS